MPGPDNLPQQHIDPVYGDVTVTTHDGSVAVEATSPPRVSIDRVEGTPVRSYIPIGTRDPSLPVLRVDGERHEITPGKGGLTRRSYRVEARVAGTDLLFSPRSPAASRLLWGTSTNPENELGSFELLDDGAVAVEWSTGVTVLGVTALRPTPEEAAVGYALAAAFGTGAQFFLTALMAVAQELPG